MQIEEKYKGDYEKALTRFRDTRAQFIKSLKEIRYLSVIPSQANFVMCQIIDTYTSKELTEKLLVRSNIFIKDLSSKVQNGKQYVRIAVRTKEENKLLIKTLRELEVDI